MSEVDAFVLVGAGCCRVSKNMPGKYLKTLELDVEACFAACQRSASCVGVEIAATEDNSVQCEVHSVELTHVSPADTNAFCANTNCYGRIAGAGFGATVHNAYFSPIIADVADPNATAPTSTGLWWKFGAIIGGVVVFAVSVLAAARKQRTALTTRPTAAHSSPNMEAALTPTALSSAAEAAGRAPSTPHYVSMRLQRRQAVNSSSPLPEIEAQNDFIWEEEEEGSEPSTLLKVLSPFRRMTGRDQV